MASLTELLADRAKAADAVAQATARLSELDTEVFRRFGVIAEAMEGRPQPLSHANPTEPQVDLPILPAWAPTPSGVVARAKRSKPGALTEAIIKVLRERGPLDRTSLYEALVSTGTHINGKDPKANLSAHLSYSKEIVRLDDGRFNVVNREGDQSNIEAQ
ncbi:MAG: hypothetical protein Q8K96_15360 [Rubrivivax sp.]|nr:hypothetical protein [Rubrivivax sp.]